MLIARFTDKMWMLQQAKKARNQGHEKNKYGNFPNISLLSCQVHGKCLEKCRLTLFFSFPCFCRPNLDEELKKSDLT